MLSLRFKKREKPEKQNQKNGKSGPYPQPFLGFSTLSTLGAAVHIDDIDERGVHGWVAYSYFCGRRSQGELCIGDKPLISIPVVIERNDVIEHFKAASAFYFRFPLDRIASALSVDDLKKEEEEKLTLKFAHTKYAYQLTDKEKESVLKASGSALNLNMILERGEESKRAASKGLVNQEKLLSKWPTTKPIAFYLPQFHSTPENDTWWGSGFTEWTNVTQARPAFNGHYQPHVPADLGFYDASQESTIKAQVELAQSYGIHGFCFHHYWFSGRRVLTKPLDLFVHLKHDLGFMICWANENWTRRWDGLENEVLLYQEHDIVKDSSFIEDIMPYLLDSRYITRADNSKWLIVYRPSLMSEPTIVFDHWRKVAADHNITLHISTVEGFDQLSREDLGVDSFIQFPPLGFHHAETITNEVIPHTHYEKINVYDYSILRNAALSTLEKFHLGKARHMVIPGVIPAWDNSARKKQNGSIIHRSTPQYFKEWVRDAAFIGSHNQSADDRFLFINAWNEWAEGAHLEPDVKYGHQYLIALNRGLLEADKLIEQEANGSLVTSADVPGKLLLKDLLRCGSFHAQCGFFDMVYFSPNRPSIFENFKRMRELDPIALNIEQVNGSNPTVNSSASTANAYIFRQRAFRQQGLYVRGWIALQHKFQHKHPVFFSLKDKNGGSLWTISSHTTSRPDVDKHTFAKSTKHYGLGFTLNAILDETVSIGTHTLEAYIVQMIDDSKEIYLVKCAIVDLEIM